MLQHGEMQKSYWFSCWRFGNCCRLLWSVNNRTP